MLKAGIVFFLAAIFAFFIQSSVIHNTIPSVVLPDIILILIVAISLKLRTVAGLILSFSLGILSDFASGQYIGPNAAASIVVFALVGGIVNRVYAERGLALIVIVFLCSLAKSLAMGSIYWVYLPISFYPYNIVRNILIEALFSALISPLVLKLLLLGNPFPNSFRAPGSLAYRWD